MPRMIYPLTTLREISDGLAYCAEQGIDPGEIPICGDTIAEFRRDYPDA